MSGMDQTVNLSAYLRARFVMEMGGKNGELQMPTTFSLDFLEECHFAVRLVVRAIRSQSDDRFQNHGDDCQITDITATERTQWSVTDYINDLRKYGFTELHEKRRKQKFPPCGQNELVSEGCVVADVNGVILMWYLPGLVSPRRQVSRLLFI